MENLFQEVVDASLLCMEAFTIICFFLPLLHHLQAVSHSQVCLSHHLFLEHWNTQYRSMLAAPWTCNQHLETFVLDNVSVLILDQNHRDSLYLIISSLKSQDICERLNQIIAAYFWLSLNMQIIKTVSFLKSFYMRFFFISLSQILSLQPDGCQYILVSVQF